MRNSIHTIGVVTFFSAIGLATPPAHAGPGAFASATDPATGITITSVGNPDGSRTVTTTEANGNVLSETSTTTPGALASSTNPETGTTTTSVGNPDGSHTVTTTEALPEPPTDGLGDSSDSLEGESYLLRAWRDANTDESFEAWWKEKYEELSKEFSDSFAEWGDDDWDDSTDADLFRDEVEWLVRAMKYGSLWRDGDGGDWKDDFEEWGDDDWDDTAEGEGDGTNDQAEESEDQGDQARRPNRRTHEVAIRTQMSVMRAAQRAAMRNTMRNAGPRGRAPVQHNARPRITISIRSSRRRG